MKINTAPLVIPVFCLAYTISQALSIDYNGGFFPSEFDRDAGGTGQDTMSVDKRYWSSSACRRCIYRRDDWRSCVTCYNRPGAPIPFYGGYRKRSSPEGIAPGEHISSSIGESSGLGFAQEKRFTPDYCQCCMASNGNAYCCARCSSIPYYGGYKKRSYHTSFVPVSVGGAGLCDLCCSPETFDYYCCAFSCGDNKRK